MEVGVLLVAVSKTLLPVGVAGVGLASAVAAVVVLVVAPTVSVAVAEGPGWCSIPCRRNVWQALMNSHLSFSIGCCWCLHLVACVFPERTMHRK
jgi:hypothetical protein